MWQVLGIEPTTDTKLIRRAYALRLREIDADKNPQLFQKLRAAYETALRLAAGNVVSRPATMFDIGNVEQIERLDPFDSEPVAKERSPFEVLSDDIAQLLKHKNYVAAFDLFDRGLARGDIPLGARENVIDGLMRTIVTDRDVSVDQLRQFLLQAGWDTIKGRQERYTQTRILATQRLDAEAWFQRLQNLAFNKSVHSADGMRLTELQRWFRLQIERHNAHVFFGSRQFWRLTSASARILEQMLAQYRHYARDLGNPVKEEYLFRADGILRRKARWGKAFNIALGAIFFVFAIVMIGLFADTRWALLVWVPLLGCRFALAFYKRWMVRVQQHS